MITSTAFRGKKYAVYGLARSGLATAAALMASGAEVSAWDAREEARGSAPRGVAIKNLDEADLAKFDSVVVTPGLPLNRHPIARRAREAGAEIIGDIELFARARRELPPHKAVGITGTNGKSTTTALVHHILKTAGVPTTMGGNIGLPILAQAPLPAGGVYVLELSSYQIDLTQSLDCDVAVLLNVTPDHLDRYESFGAYQQSKERLFHMQSGDSVALIAADDMRCDEFAHRMVSDREWADKPSARRFDGGSISDQSRWPALQGPHNASNAAAAVAVAKELGVEGEAIEEALRTYPGLPHRMERVRDKDGILFVNDSKATNPTATAPALAAFDHIRWICGGQAKTSDLDECAPHLGHVVKAYTIGEAGELFARLLSPHIAVAECGTLDSAMRAVTAEATSGDTVLLSPACASFDQFRSFEDRGEQFRALVGAL